MKIIQINGFRGLLTVAFIGVCLFAGFVVFPGLVAMHLWNKYLVTLASFPVINLIQGTLLWGITAVSYVILTKGNMPVSFKHVNEFRNSEVENIIKQAKIQSQIEKINKEIQLSDKFEKRKEEMLNVNNKDLSDLKTVISSVESSKSDSEDKVSNLK
jgi:hypothetical protein